MGPNLDHLESTRLKQRPPLCFTPFQPSNVDHHCQIVRCRVWVRVLFRENIVVDQERAVTLFHSLFC